MLGEAPGGGTEDDSPAQEADASAVAPRLRGREAQKEDLGQKEIETVDV